MGKGTISYEMITRFDSLDMEPKQEFFYIEQFYLRITGHIISEEEYEAVKKLYLTMKIENLGELNMLYEIH